MSVPSNEWHKPYDLERSKTIKLSEDEIQSAHFNDEHGLRPQSHHARGARQGAKNRLLSAALTFGGAVTGVVGLNKGIDVATNRRDQIEQHTAPSAKPRSTEVENDPYAEIHEHRPLKERLQMSGMQGVWARRELERLSPWRSELRKETIYQEQDKSFRELVIACARVVAGRFYKQEVFSHKIEQHSYAEERIIRMTDDAVASAIRMAVNRYRDQNQKETSYLEAEILTMQVFARVAHDFFNEHPERAQNSPAIFESLVDRLSELQSFSLRGLDLSEIPNLHARFGPARIAIKQLQFGTLRNEERINFISEFQGSFPENALSALRADEAWFFTHRDEIRHDPDARHNTLNALELFTHDVRIPAAHRRELVQLQEYLDAGR